jgi:hypothetical protein
MEGKILEIIEDSSVHDFLKPVLINVPNIGVLDRYKEVLLSAM